MTTNEVASNAAPAQKPSLLRKLAVSLLNATIMLLIILCVVAIILISKVQSFTTDTVHAAVGAIGQEKGEQITQGFGQLKTMGGKLKNIQATIKDTCKDGINTPGLDKLNGEVSALNQNIQNLNTNVHDLGNKASNAAIDGAAKAVKNWLGVSPIQPGPNDG